jgi:branched-chain amino acid transport system substrate-binding protein
MKRLVSVAAGAACLLTALAACGESDETTGQEPGPAGVASGPYGGFTLDEPLVLGELWEIQGESAVAIDDFQNGAQLAVDEINAAGGVGGHPISVIREPFSPVDAQAARRGFLELAEQEPSMLLGAAGSTLASLQRDVEATGIPLLANLSDNKVLYGAESGSRWIFSAPASYLDLAAGAAQFAAEELAPGRVGLFNTSDPSNTAAIAATADALAAEDIAVSGTETVDATASDVTSSLLALGEADTVIAAAFPQPLALALKARQQNELTSPLLSIGVSGSIIVSSGAVSDTQTDGFYTSVQCNPASRNTATIERFTSAYEAEFGTAPTTQAAVQYDSIYLAAEAVKQAGSTDPEVLRDALLEVSYTAGVCTDDYHADGAQLMSHNVSIVSWENDAEVVETYTFPDHDELS